MQQMFDLYITENTNNLGHLGVWLKAHFHQFSDKNLTLVAMLEILLIKLKGMLRKKKRGIDVKELIHTYNEVDHAISTYDNS